MTTSSIDSQPVPKQITRRRFLKFMGAAGLVGAVSIGGAAYASEVEPKNLTTEFVQVSLSRLPGAFDGIKIAHLSDLHMGADVPGSLIERAVELSNAERPDLVAITGDLISYSWRNMEPCVRLLSKLSARMGVYVVYGNHDYWAGNLMQTMASVRRAGLILLRNQSIPLTRGNSRLYLIGIDDWYVNLADLGRALQGVPSNALKIALMHEPDFADYSAEAEIDLQLSGHSHGGQVRLPGVGAPVLPLYGRKYPMGLAHVGDLTQVYKTRGVGVLPPAVRFNCPPEVTILQLVRS